MRLLAVLFFGFASGALGASTGSAQMPGPKDDVPRPENAVPPTENPTPQTVPNSGASELPLSEKLDRQEGVLKPPPGIDPDIKRSPPDPVPGKMPVIPPPGEPGGDQSVQPK